jgi:hypothetical protein
MIKYAIGIFDESLIQYVAFDEERGAYLTPILMDARLFNDTTQKIPPVYCWLPVFIGEINK